MVGLALYGKALGNSYFLFGTDTISHDYVMHRYGWDISILQRGELPWWCPYMFCGWPFIGSTALCPFYPTQWLYALVPFNTGFTLQYVFAVAVAGSAFAWWMRTRGHSHAWAFWGGLAWCWSGHFLTLSYAGHLQKMIALAWVPAALGAAEVILQETRGGTILRNGRLLRGLLILALAWAMQLLASHPQIFYATFLLVLLRIVAPALGSVPWRELRPGGQGMALMPVLRKLKFAGWSMGLTAAALVAAVALSAAQLLPLLEMNAVSNRASGVDYAEAVQTSYPPFEILEYIAPTFLGDSIRQSPVPYFGKWGDPERIVSDYLGLPLLFLAAVALVAGRGRYRWFLAAIGLAALIIGLGRFTPLYRVLYWILPFFKGFRSPGTFMFITSLAVIALAVEGGQIVFALAKSWAASGWQSVLAAKSTAPAAPTELMHKVEPRTIASAVGLTIAAVAVFVGLYAMSRAFRFNLAYTTPPERIRYQVFRDVMIVALELALVAGAFGLCRWLPKSAPAVLLGAALVLPLLHNRRFIVFDKLIGYREFLDKQPLLDKLEKQPDIKKPVRMMDVTDGSVKAIVKEIGVAAGYHPVTLAGYEWFAKMLGPRSTEFTRRFAINYARSYSDKPPAEGGFKLSEKLRRLGQMEYLWERIAPAKYFTAPPIRPVDGNRLAAGKAFLAEMAAGKTKSTDTSPDTEADSGREGSVSADEAPAFVEQRHAVRYRLTAGPQNARGLTISWSPHKLEVRSEARAITAPSRALLVLAEFYAPGWRASTVAGADVPVISINGVQRGLVVPPGDHVVTVTYAPFSARLGIFLSLLAVTILACFAGGTAARRLRRFKTEQTAPKPDEAQPASPTT